MKTSDGSFHYCYNAQTVVDEDSQIILNTKLVPSGAISLTHRGPSDRPG